MKVKEIKMAVAETMLTASQLKKKARYKQLGVSCAGEHEKFEVRALRIW